MKTSEFHNLQVGIGGLRKLNRGVCLETQHVRGSHRAAQIDDQLRIGPLEFNEARGKPESSQSFRDREPNLTRDSWRGSIAGSDESKRSKFHFTCCSEDFFTFRSDPDAIYVPREELYAKLVFQLADAAA